MKVQLQVNAWLSALLFGLFASTRGLPTGYSKAFLHGSLLAHIFTGNLNSITFFITAEPDDSAAWPVDVR